MKDALKLVPVEPEPEAGEVGAADEVDVWVVGAAAAVVVGGLACTTELTLLLPLTWRH